MSLDVSGLESTLHVPDEVSALDTSETRAFDVPSEVSALHTSETRVPQIERTNSAKQTRKRKVSDEILSSDDELPQSKSSPLVIRIPPAIKQEETELYCGEISQLPEGSFDYCPYLCLH